MGVWGVGNFENDSALDWLFDFGENDFRLIDRTLAGVAAMVDGDQLEVDEASEVLAAAECVAAAGGHPAGELPDELDEWLSANHPIKLKPDLVVMARRAVERVRLNSELQELWDETDEREEWHSVVADLQDRLQKVNSHSS